MGMNVNAIIHCLKDTTAIDCLACPQFAERKGSITSCRMQRFDEAREIIEKYQKIKQIVETDLSFPSDVQLEEIFKVINDYESFLFDKEESHVD